MKLLTVLLTALFAAMICQAQSVDIYKIKFKAKYTGDGSVTRANFTGYTVMSSDYSRSAQFLIYPGRYLGFSVRTNIGLFPIVPAGTDKTDICIVQAYSPRPGIAATALAKGAPVVLAINNQRWIGARAMSWSGRAMLGGILEEMNGTLILDPLETATSSRLTDTFDTAVARLYTGLLNGGYVVVPSDELGK